MAITINDIGCLCYMHRGVDIAETAKAFRVALTTRGDQ